MAWTGATCVAIILTTNPITNWMKSYKCASFDINIFIISARERRSFSWHCQSWEKDDQPYYSAAIGCYRQRTALASAVYKLRPRPITVPATVCRWRPTGRLHQSSIIVNSVRSCVRNTQHHHPFPPSTTTTTAEESRFFIYCINVLDGWTACATLMADKGL